MKCSGFDVHLGAEVDIRFDRTLLTVTQHHRHAGFQGRVPEQAIFVAPGFIDLQVNGFAGVDFNDPTTSVDDIGHAIGVLFSTGVTRFYPTVITGPPERMSASLQNLSRVAGEIENGGAVAGLHVEGPHISAEDGPRGAHPREWVRPPDIAEFHRWQDEARGLIRMVTIAPDWPDAPHYIETIVREGVVAAIGHTAATGEQIRDAVAAGATISTHLGNGAHQMMRRHPNYIWEQLAEDRLIASFIADGIHLDRAFLQTAIRAKGAAQSVLVTDASTPAGSVPGAYRLGELAIELTGSGRVVLAGTDRLAGSALRMDAAVSNAVRLAGVDWSAALAMATTNAARAGGIRGRMAGLIAGDRADLVRFRIDAGNVKVLETWLDGRRVFAG